MGSRLNINGIVAALKIETYITSNIADSLIAGLAVILMIKYVQIKRGPGSSMGYKCRSLDLTTHTSLSPIRRVFVPGFVNYKNGCTRLAAASDKVYQLSAHGRWFSPGTPAFSTTKNGFHDIHVAEILLKVVLKHTKNQSNDKVCPDLQS